MMYKSQLKKAQSTCASWLQDFGTLLLGIAAILEVIYKIVTWLRNR